MNNIPDSVTFTGNKLTLVGNTVSVGDKAPAFSLLANDLSPVTLESFKGRILVVSAVLSLDTGVCDTETVRFNKEAAKLDDNVAMLTVSMDLPFAQARFCEARAIASLQVVSDHYDASFGNAYGILIKELRLLTRVVFIIDSEGIIRYIQLMEEATHEPDYDEVIEALKDIN